MQFSYNWLQTYFKDKLPDANELGELLTMHSFEVESVGKNGDDYLLDIDILPNRAHDCLSHRGVAQEIATLLDKKIVFPKTEDIVGEKTNLKITNKDEKLCRRYIGRVIKDIKIGDSPKWLKERLENIGQKSINNIVDITNLVMFDLGQPVHAFDLEKVNGGIIVRKSKEGEKITTLDNKEILLDDDILIIADEQEPLALAGIKGGKKAEVDNNTINIILESANFEPVNIRKTSQKINIKTDSSKRFENEITPELAEEGIKEATRLILEIAGGEIEELIDIYPRKRACYKTGVSLDEINRTLGTELSEKEVENIWQQIGFEYEKVIPREKVLELATKLVGTPYKFGASISYDAPNFFDCSSFTAYLFAQVGISIPRMSIDQYIFGEEKKEGELQAGDLVFSVSDDDNCHSETKEYMSGQKIEKGISHCGLYLGDGKIIQSAGLSSKGEIIIEKLKESLDFKNIVGFRSISGLDDKRYVISVPAKRLDLKNKEDLIEEIGRIYGYKNIKPRLSEFNDNKAEINKEFYYINEIKNTLIELGFSEVSTYTFFDSGDIEVKKPIASDKNYLRTSLERGMRKARDFNAHYVDLLGVENIKIFEIGKVFPKKGEEEVLAIISNSDKETEIAIRGVFEKMGGEVDYKIEDGFVQINTSELFEKLPEPDKDYDLKRSELDKIKIISQYPFMKRDISVFVPNEIKGEEIVNIVKKEAGDILVNHSLFDVFKKEEKTSYAYHLIFQSKEKTLKDDDLNIIMKKIEKDILSNGWKVR